MLLRRTSTNLGKIIVLATILLVILSACQFEPELVEESLAGAPPVVPTVTMAPTASLASPLVANTTAPPAAEAADLPAFSLVEVPPTLTPAAAEENELRVMSSATAEPTAEPSPTPQPTFTPPALPFTSTNEHYWLRRPIAEGGTVWTDKAYPYGGTRGGALRPHHGVEFYVPSGTEVLAAASGAVRVAGTDSEIVYGPHKNFYGNLVVIELDTQFLGMPVYNLYAHLSDIFVTEGQQVAAEEIIALSGASGVADGPHLHFEVRVGENDYGSTRNPLLWLYPFPENGTVVGQVAWPSGELVQGAQIFLRRVDAPSKYAETTSYTNDDIPLNADEGWQENFAFDDVEAGYYEVEVRRGTRKIKEEVWVFPYRTSSVEITLDW
ncbi:MAG: M23 family metallopeptidase [Candidatus Promineifilaceae bacterium]|nr:M23 family metallopeptidase [Candidatus Promineifilaceae bacterium]